MIKETISDKQTICLIILFTWGSKLIIGTGGEAKMDMWFAILFAMILGLIITTVYSRILYHFPQKDIFDIDIKLFGKVIGNIVNIFFTLVLSPALLTATSLALSKLSFDNI